MADAPADFREEIAFAAERGRSGDLALLAEEVRRFGFQWAEEGLRLLVEAARGVQAAESEELGAVLAFTGHRIDAPGRETPRFPATAEPRARVMIREAVAGALDGAEKRVIGYAGGASGGDILFHEVCEELGVETRLLLAGPREDYLRASVVDSGADWVRRFDELYARLESRTRVLSEDLELPAWLRSVPGYSIWQRNNLWELETAFAHGSALTILIALWNHQTGDGPGGTEDMVRIARGRGARTVILDANKLVDT